MIDGNEPLSIAQTALLLRSGYQKTRDLLLRGELSGTIDKRGRLWVDRSSVERILNGRRQSDQTPNPDALSGGEIVEGE